MTRIYPSRADSLGVALFARGGTAKLDQVLPDCPGLIVVPEAVTSVPCIRWKSAAHSTESEVVRFGASSLRWRAGMAAVPPTRRCARYPTGRGGIPEFVGREGQVPCIHNKNHEKGRLAGWSSPAEGTSPSPHLRRQVSDERGRCNDLAANPRPHHPRCDPDVHAPGRGPYESSAP